MSNNRDYKSRDHAIRASIKLLDDLVTSLCAAGVPVSVAGSVAMSAIRQVPNNDLVRIGRDMLRSRSEVLRKQ